MAYVFLYFSSFSCIEYYIGGADGKPIVFTTTPKPAQLLYNVEFIIKSSAQDAQNLQPGSPGYNELANQVLTNVQPVFEKVPGFLVADVVDL